MSRETVTPEGPARLKPLTLPLRGSQLIEASAGTGKTFIVQSIADILGSKLVVINLNQQVRSTRLSQSN